MEVNDKSLPVSFRRVVNIVLDVWFKKQVNDFSFRVILLNKFINFWFSKFLLWYNFKSLIWWFDFFINQKVGIFLFLLIITKRIFLNTSKTLFFKFIEIEFWYSLIIEVIPWFFICSYVRSIMSSLWNSIMDDDSFKFIFIVLFFSIALLL